MICKRICFGDRIGEFYMHELGNHSLGQYFTPEDVCKMTVQMTIGGEPKPVLTVLEPARGSGRMLLVAASINRDLQLYGADLDNTFCKWLSRI